VIDQYAEVVGKRVRLIVKKFSVGLTPGEIEELTHLTNSLRKLLARVPPDELRRLSNITRGELLPVKRGPPPTYTEETFERVQALIDAGATPKEACFQVNLPLQRWYARKIKKYD